MPVIFGYRGICISSGRHGSLRDPAEVRGANHDFPFTWKSEDTIMAHRQLFPASVIGSMPRPDFVKDLIADDCPYSGEEHERLMSAAIRSVVALQEAAGLDVVSDGEWRRKSYIGVIAELAHGFQLSRNPADGRPWRRSRPDRK